MRIHKYFVVCDMSDQLNDELYELLFATNWKCIGVSIDKAFSLESRFTQLQSCCQSYKKENVKTVGQVIANLKWEFIVQFRQAIS